MSRVLVLLFAVAVLGGCSKGGNSSLSSSGPADPDVIKKEEVALLYKELDERYYLDEEDRTLLSSVDPEAAKPEAGQPSKKSDIP